MPQKKYHQYFQLNFLTNENEVKGKKREEEYEEETIEKEPLAIGNEVGGVVGGR